MRGLRQAAGFYWVAAFVLLLLILPSWPPAYERWETTFALIGSTLLIAGAIAIPVLYFRKARALLSQTRGTDVAAGVVVAATVSSIAGILVGSTPWVALSLLAGGIAGVALWLATPAPDELDRPASART